MSWRRDMHSQRSLPTAILRQLWLTVFALRSFCTSAAGFLLFYIASRPCHMSTHPRGIRTWRQHYGRVMWSNDFQRRRDLNPSLAWVMRSSHELHVGVCCLSLGGWSTCLGDHPLIIDQRPLYYSTKEYSPSIVRLFVWVNHKSVSQSDARGRPDRPRSPPFYKLSSTSRGHRTCRWLVTARLAGESICWSIDRLM